jgi:DNA invertase Pin-like site-specific DNA recombinase
VTSKSTSGNKPTRLDGYVRGVVVARLDRFARSAVDALESIKRLNGAGARLVSAEDHFDGSTPMGRFAIGILTLIAELESERIKENWDTAVREAIGPPLPASVSRLIP